ncbi:hypothetical protein FOZ63_007167, partial [Perkinsus olseni]
MYLGGLKKKKKITKKKESIRELGGPVHGDVPLLGFLPWPTVRLLDLCHILADTHGDVFKMKLMGKPWVVIYNTDVIHQILKARPGTFIRRMNEDEAEVKGMVNSEGETWKRNRRLGAPAF